ncbi:type II toxin-antitoxin system HicB family antitoxin [Pseudoduganella namucuonensis]|uniref:HicB_like antitoxin of toxin-antitoxin system n=1 Tax=Pseudoduganella namucuonensis TaxID=1035707 RepID=A0A1I7IWL4_9BURK|nr:type II toxin-antitoxin system HicB family antitoxin [Pseudoduganella namucuonensis]SFU77241.1 HicB_like antitoxin of toxin-antitoxin system [Pseudoduganella namucuonensis]
MYYPLYVWKDSGSAYGATFPDLPGVNTAADEIEDLPAMAQEAVECMYDGEDSMPPASPIEHWKDSKDYQSGFWMLIDINLAQIPRKNHRTT